VGDHTTDIGQPYPEDGRTYFNAAALPEPQNTYVCWIDVMGTQAIMARSVSMSANFICKLHQAILMADAAEAKNLTFYPMMDGAYVTVEDKAALECFLRDVFFRLAKTFISENKQQHRFIQRRLWLLDQSSEGVPSIARPVGFWRSESATGTLFYSEYL